MIEGLHIDVPGKTVKELLEREAERLKDRHASATKDLEVLERQFAEDPSREEQYKSTSMQDPRNAVKQRRKDYMESAMLTKFMADHIVITETYRLERNSLHHLGFFAASRF
jgi:hypothetical protein